MIGSIRNIARHCKGYLVYVQSPVLLSFCHDLFDLVVASNISLFYFVDGPKLTDQNFSDFKTLDLLLWWRSVGD